MELLQGDASAGGLGVDDGGDEDDVELGADSTDLLGGRLLGVLGMAPALVGACPVTAG